MRKSRCSEELIIVILNRPKPAYLEGKVICPLSGGE
jgi:hypothetical protein